jgi:anti-sigma B factor antagonist
MDMTVEEVGGVTRIALVGMLDAKGASAVEVRFAAVTASHPKVAVDLTGVEYLASIGIRMLVMAGKAAAGRGGKLALFGASEPVAKVIGASGLDLIVPLAADWAAACGMVA